VGISDDVLSQVWLQRYSSLVRLAALLLDDASTAEDIVQEAYIRACAGTRTLRDAEAGAAYLSRTVVNLARSHGRHLSVRRRHAQREQAQPRRDEPSAEAAALARLRSDALVAALQTLARRQREAIVLRYYGGLTEAQTAAAMNVSVGSVKGYCSRGLDALGEQLGDLR
jgi:RNA polymerase sigma factor (sigma-70 family)